MGALIERIKDWWLNAESTQKIVSVLGAVFLVVLIGATLMFAGQPQMTPVYTGLADADKQAVFDELRGQGFNVTISDRGDVQVPRSDLPRARMALAGANKTPKSAEGGMSLIESIGIGDSQRKENEKILAAKARDLEQSILTMEGVSQVQVHLSMGKDSPFGDQTIAPSAAIRLTEAQSGAINPEQAKAIARLVQNSVTGLQSSGVTVVTSEGRMIFDGAEQDSTTFIANKKMEAEAAESRRRTQDLQRELDAVFGAGNTLVKVDVVLNMDATQIARDETLRTGEAIIDERSRESMSGQGDANGGGAGVEANTPGQPIAGAGGGGAQNYNSEVSSRQYPTSNTKTNITKAAGEIVAMNVSVMANDSVITDVAPLEQRVASYIAPWAGDERFSANVTSVPFSDAATRATERAATEAANAQRMQQIISLLPVVALVVVALFLMKALGKALKTPTQTLALANGQTISIPANIDPQVLALIEQSATTPTLASTGTSSSDTTALARPARGEDGEERDPYADLPEGVFRPGEADDDDVPYDVASIKQRVDVPLEQIRKMAKKNPEVVATMLKTWMMEDPK